MFPALSLKIWLNLSRSPGTAVNLTIKPYMPRSLVASARMGRLTHIESAPLAATMEVSKTHGPQQGAALMKRSTKHVALDVHQATTLASVREDSGRVIARSILPTEAPALVEFFRGMRGTIHVAFEEGTQAQWLHELLTPLVDQV